MICRISLYFPLGILRTFPAHFPTPHRPDLPGPSCIRKLCAILIFITDLRDLLAICLADLSGCWVLDPGLSRHHHYHHQPSSFLALGPQKWLEYRAFGTKDKSVKLLLIMQQQQSIIIAWKTSKTRGIKALSLQGYR